jgi:predicted DNA-binding transcriptional regulator AlpA
MTASDARDEPLSVEDVSAMTGIAKSTLYTWRGRGYGPRSVRFGGRVIYLRSEVEAWIAKQQATTWPG